MATFSYNTGLTNVAEIYTATSGGTVFSANLATSTAFDYFSDTAVVNDAIYFSPGANSVVQSDFVFNVGTALVGVDVVLKWEYYKRGVGWTDMLYVIDDTNGFTTTGVNRVRFPLQWSRGTRVINGLTRMWTRCRIASLTSISEGGANTTNRVRSSDGRVIISGGTDASPTSFTELVTLCNANIPHIPVTKSVTNVFDLTNIAFAFTGRCVTKSETILVGSNGPSSQGAGQNSLNYITSGVKQGTRGSNGSVFIVYGNSNSAVLNNGSQTKLYGTTIKTGKEQADSGTSYGYHDFSGENVDCSFESSAYLTNANLVNSRICDGFVIAGAPSQYLNNAYICFSGTIFYCYTVSWTLTGFSYQFVPSSASLFFIYQGSGYDNQQWNLVNPGTPIGLVTDPIKVTSISNSAPVNLAGCKYYNSVAGTYTDYLTEATNDTAGDVPLSGEVGDYYLFGVTAATSTSNGFSLQFDLPTQTNDYEYAWEVWRTNAWIAINPTYMWDVTLNLKQTGILYTGATLATAVTIDGLSAKWIRARITKKGTTTPTATRIRRAVNSATSNWSIKEQWSVDLKIVDDNGDAIEGATVVVSNGFSTATVETDASGAIAQQILTAKEWHFDPVNNPTTLISQNLYPTFNLTISKAGYETYTASGVTLDKPANTVVALKKTIPIRTDIDGNVYKAIKAETGSSAKLLAI